MGCLYFSVFMTEPFHNENLHWTGAAAQTNPLELNRMGEGLMRFTGANQVWTPADASTISQESRVAPPLLEPKREAMASFPRQGHPWLPAASPMNSVVLRKQKKTETMRRWREKMKRNPREYIAYLEKQNVYTRKSRAKRKQNS